MSLAEHLEKALVFQKIVQAGSLRKASKDLRLSQPALTRTLSILERECDCALVVRTQEGLKLTPQGQNFLEYCRKLQQLTEEVKIKLNEGEEKYEAFLQMGTYESIAVYLFPFFLKYLKDRQQKLRLNLKTSSSASLMEELKMSRLDMIVSVNPKVHRSVVTKILYNDTFGFYSKFPERNIDVTLIGVRKATSESGKSIDDYLSDYKLNKLEWIDCASFETVKALAVEGLGIAILPTRVAAPLVKQKLLHKVQIPKTPADFGEHFVGFSFLKNRESDPAIQWIFREMKTFLSI